MNLKDNSSNYNNLTENNFQHNTIADSSDANAIAIYGSSFNRFQYNTIAYHRLYAFYIDYNSSQNNSILENAILDNNQGWFEDKDRDGYSQAYDGGMNNSFSNNYFHDLFNRDSRIHPGLRPR